MSGFWMPHSSSVEFCEPNYLLTKYLVEPHNGWSSLAISLMALIGLIAGNPTKESRFIAAFGVLFFVGIGSFGLHSTLHWTLQSADEVPMLWENWAIIYCMIEIKSPVGQPRYKHLHVIIMAIAILQTIIYYRYQNFFTIFLISYISLVLIIVIWTAHLVLRDKVYEPLPVRWKLWSRALFSYVAVGSVVWILDMNFCELLLPFYNQLGGLTLHILWHLAAGYGTYLTITLLVAIRCQNLGIDFELSWILGILPACVEKKRIE